VYENQTEQLIEERMLARVPASRDKREGSIIYDSTMPASIELMMLYVQLDWYIKQSFGDTADREYLVRLALERGLEPYDATYAIVKGYFTPSTIDVLGKRFSLDTINYVVAEKVSNGVFLLQCETAGVVGNTIDGQLIPIEYIQGLESATLTEVTIPGEDEEDTEVFRQRYLKSFNNNAYGGNIADYREKVDAIAGVGGVKVYPVWQGGGTVRVVFMTSEYKPPSAEFVDSIQTTIDPIPNQGLGIGIAPIGHIVTVQGAQNSAINIGLNLTFASGYTFSDLQDDIQTVIDNYFSELNQSWPDTQIATSELLSNTGLVVRISQIESRLLTIAHIIDAQNTTLNGVADNLTLGTDELAVRGVVSG